MRRFLTVNLPDSLAAGVAAIQDRLSDADGPRFTNPESAHVTLRSLDEVSSDRVGAVKDAVELAVETTGAGPFDASVGGLGVFPSLDYIQVVWIGVDDDAAKLTRLHEAIEREMTALGLDPENHEFTPHIMFAHMGDARGKVLMRRVVEGEPPTAGSFRVYGVRLKESDFGPDGFEYETAARVSL